MQKRKCAKKVFSIPNKVCVIFTLSKEVLLEKLNTKRESWDQKMKNRLSEIRWRKGWSQAALARRSGVAKTTICEIENGNISNPSVEIAYKLSKALNVDVWEIFYME